MVDVSFPRYSNILLTSLLQIILTVSHGDHVTITQDALNPTVHPQSLPRPVQTCSLQNPPSGVGSTHRTGMFILVLLSLFDNLYSKIMEMTCRS